MPQPPGFIGKVNGIIRYFENPCDASWTVYLETAVPAAKTALITLVDFDYIDIARGILRPAPIGRGPHVRKKNRPRPRPRFRGIPEVGELIGNKVGNALDLPHRRIGMGQRIFWIIDTVTQRLLWHWLVISVSVDFFYEWHSGILKSTKCSESNRGFAHYRSGDPSTFFSVANAWTSINAANEISQRFNATALNAVHWNGGKPFTGVTGIAVQQQSPGGGPIEIRTTIFGGPTQINRPGPDDNGPIGMGNSGTQFVTNQYRTNGATVIGTADCTTFGTAPEPL